MGFTVWGFSEGFCVVGLETFGVMVRFVRYFAQCSGIEILFLFLDGIGLDHKTAVVLDPIGDYFSLDSRRRSAKQQAYGKEYVT